MDLLHFVLFIALGFSYVTKSTRIGNSSDIDRVLNDEEHHPRVLSRRKRFIVFPDGSSFQLVYCAQNHGYLQLGNIVWFGNTAALAWELPSDPKIFSNLKDYKSYEAQNRNDVNSKHILYLDERGKVLAKVPYRRKILVNPAFAKRSVGPAPKANKQSANLIKTVPIKQMHDKQLRTVLQKELENVQFHRDGRRGLYEKLESFIEALGWKGKECILRLLCEAGQVRHEQGTFTSEIMRAIFTLPQGQDFLHPAHKAYDEAHQAADCKTYSECKNRLTGESF